MQHLVTRFENTVPSENGKRTLIHEDQVLRGPLLKFLKFLLRKLRWRLQKLYKGQSKNEFEYSVSKRVEQFTQRVKDGEVRDYIGMED